MNQLANYAGVDATSFTQEIRLNWESDRSRYLAGFYYLNIDTDSDNWDVTYARVARAETAVRRDAGFDGPPGFVA